jgi:hypothetical protein
VPLASGRRKPKTPHLPQQGQSHSPSSCCQIKARSPTSSFGLEKLRTHFRILKQPPDQDINRAPKTAKSPPCFPTAGPRMTGDVLLAASNQRDSHRLYRATHHQPARMRDAPAVSHHQPARTTAGNQQIAARIPFLV